MNTAQTQPANDTTPPRLLIPCACVEGCVLCTHGLRPIDRLDVVRLRRTALNRGYTSTVRFCDRALADADDIIAWHECAEALR